MNILSFQATNFARLSFVRIDAAGRPIVLSGKNANGKSSVLNAIESALQGKGASPTRPVREGADEGEIVLELGDGSGAALKVTKTYRDGRERLVVENADGVRQGSPQTVLDKLRGAVGFDPLGFAHPAGAKTEAAADKERLRMLLEIAPLPIDLDAWREERAEVYRERTDANRALKAAEGRVPPARTGPMPQRVDVAEAMKRLSDAEAVERDWAVVKALVDRLGADMDRRSAEIQRLEAAQRRDMDERCKAIEHLDSLPVPDTAGLRDTIARASEQNEVAAKAEAEEKARDRALADVEDATARVSQLNERLAALDAQKDEALASVTLPAEGLSIGDDGVLLNGLPFSAASTSEKIRASVRVAAAMNPTLRVALIRDGNALDQDAMRELLAFAEESDLQLWVERVVPDMSGSVEIEDGTVREAVAS